MQRGGKVDRSDDKDMVNGVASILRRVKDKKNRLQLANQLSNQFNREKVKYSLNDFLNKSKVKK
jgi:ABC-type phosphate transport system auxiliary subunit